MAPDAPEEAPWSRGRAYRFAGRCSGHHRVAGAPHTLKTTRWIRFPGPAPAPPQRS